MGARRGFRIYLNYFQGCILTMEILRWFLFCFNRVHSDNQTREALPHSGPLLYFEIYLRLVSWWQAVRARAPLKEAGPE